MPCLKQGRGEQKLSRASVNQTIKLTSDKEHCKDVCIYIYMRSTQSQEDEMPLLMYVFFETSAFLSHMHNRAQGHTIPTLGMCQGRVGAMFCCMAK